MGVVHVLDSRVRTMDSNAQKYGQMKTWTFEGGRPICVSSVDSKLCAVFGHVLGINIASTGLWNVFNCFEDDTRAMEFLQYPRSSHMVDGSESQNDEVDNTGNEGNIGNGDDDDESEGNDDDDDASEGNDDDCDNEGGDHGDDDDDNDQSDDDDDSENDDDENEEDDDDDQDDNERIESKDANQTVSPNGINQPSCSGLSNPTQNVPTTPVDVSAPSTSRGVENPPTAANSKRNSNVATKRTQPRKDSGGPPSKIQVIDEVCGIFCTNFPRFKKIYAKSARFDAELKMKYINASFQKIIMEKMENIPVSQNRKHDSSRKTNVKKRTKNTKMPISRNSVEFQVQQLQFSERTDPLIYAIEKSKTYLKFYFQDIKNCHALSFVKSYETLSFKGRHLYLLLLVLKHDWHAIDSIKNSIKSDDIDVEAVCDEISKIGFLHIKDEPTKAIKLTEEVRDYFNTLIIAATCPFYEGREYGRLLYLWQALSKLGKKEASLLPLSVTSRVLFKDVVHFEEYITSLKLLDELNGAKKNLVQVSKICEEAHKMLKKILDENDNREILNDNAYYRKFMAADVLAQCLSSSIDIIKKPKNDLALNCIELLLGQEYFVQHRRAYWYNSKVLILEQCGSIDQIIQTLKQGLQDVKLSFLGLRIISRKASLYIRRKKKLSVEKIRELEAQLSLPTNIRTIDAVPRGKTPKTRKGSVKVNRCSRKMNRKKQLFESMKNDICNPDSKYRIDKGQTFKNLVLLLFYPVIYDTRVEMFVSDMQYLPLDWGGENFYKAREDHFKERCQQLNSYDESEIQNIIVNSPLVKKGLLHHSDGRSSTMMRQVSFPKIDNNEDKEFMVGLMKAMTVQKFVKAAIYLLENFDERKSGFPSVTIYDETECKFVEMLGSTSDMTLTVNEVLWLEKLNEFGLNGIKCQAVDTIKCTTQKMQLGNETPSY